MATKFNEESVLTRFKNWINIRDDEMGLFLGSTIFLFLIRCSGIIFNNFTETAFLKRFGVEYLPFLYILNPLVTIIIMAGISRLLIRISGHRMISWFLIFSGITVALFRLLIPLDYSLTYPLLFIIKVQFEMLLGLLFWNFANDLFNFGQSKRLFPLITAGGVIGDIVGSLATPILVYILPINNFLLVYLVLTMMALVLVHKIKKSFPVSLIVKSKFQKNGKGMFFLKQFQEMGSIMKESRLVTILILLTFFSNIILPVMNYQFNFAIDNHFTTETGMINFFGYFRGCINIISLFLLFFAGKLYGKLGLPVVLMFHPLNYIFVFLAFLFQFNIFSAIYARFSTNLFRTNFNKPVSNILIGIFPESHRSKIRPFLRGIVARTALMTGSIAILLSENLFHPKFLSLVALPFVAAWILTIVYLKRNYSNILLNLLSMNDFNLKSMKKIDLQKLFNDKVIQEKLLHGLLSSKGEDALAYADLLRFLEVKELDTHILAVIKDQDEKTITALLGLLSHMPEKEALEIFKLLINVENRELMISLCNAAKKLEFFESVSFFQDLVDQCTEQATKVCRFPEVRGRSIGTLFKHDPDKYGELIESLLKSIESKDVKTGIIAAGESGDVFYISALKKMVNHPNCHDDLLPFLIVALNNLNFDEIQTLAGNYLFHGLRKVRMEALKIMEIYDDKSLKKVISLIGDSSDEIHNMAKNKIKRALYQNNYILVESLNSFNNRIKKGIFALLEDLDIKDIDIFYFFKDHIFISYIYLLVIDELSRFKESSAKGLLITHLKERKEEHIKTVLRIAALKDDSGRMEIVFQGFFSKDARQRSNAIEAMENIMDSVLIKIFMPLVDDSTFTRAIKIGRKNFNLPEFDHDLTKICSFLLGNRHWVTIVLALSVALECKLEKIDKNALDKLLNSKNKIVKDLACQVKNKEAQMESKFSMQDKIMYIRKVNIFKNLAINELAAIAAIAREQRFPPGEVIFREGEFSETMYIVVTGELTASKNRIFMGKFVPGNGFGFSAFFMDAKRLVTFQTERDTNLLAIHKIDFEEMLMQYPQIAIDIAKIQTQRVEHLLNKIDDNKGRDKFL